MASVSWDDDMLPHAESATGNVSAHVDSPSIPRVWPIQSDILDSPSSAQNTPSRGCGLDDGEADSRSLPAAVDDNLPSLTAPFLCADPYPAVRRNLHRQCAQVPEYQRLSAIRQEQFDIVLSRLWGTCTTVPVQMYPRKHSGATPRYLDIGCGAGFWMMDACLHLGNLEVHGVDNQVPATLSPSIVSPTLYSLTSAHLGHGSLPYGNARFDLVRMCDLTTRLSAREWHHLLAEAQRLLCPGGWIEIIEVGSPVHAARPISAVSYDDPYQTWPRIAVPVSLSPASEPPVLMRLRNWLNEWAWWPHQHQRGGQAAPEHIGDYVRSCLLEEPLHDVTMKMYPVRGYPADTSLAIAEVAIRHRTALGAASSEWYLDRLEQHLRSPLLKQGIVTSAEWTQHLHDFTALVDCGCVALPVWVISARKPVGR